MNFNSFIFTKPPPLDGADSLASDADGRAAVRPPPDRTVTGKRVRSASLHFDKPIFNGRPIYLFVKSCPQGYIHILPWDLQISQKVRGFIFRDIFVISWHPSDWEDIWTIGWYWICSQSAYKILIYLKWIKFRAGLISAVQFSAKINPPRKTRDMSRIFHDFWTFFSATKGQGRRNERRAEFIKGNFKTVKGHFTSAPDPPVFSSTLPSL